MGKTLDLGRRIELHSMDKHCENISLGLYQRTTDTGPRFLVHTYSSVPSAGERIAFINNAVKSMVGLVDIAAEPGWIRFTCGQAHGRALRRVFLDLCKLETGAPLEPKPLIAFDKKADCELCVLSLSGGLYQVKARKDDQQATRRAAAVAKGYIKLCEMHEAEDVPNGMFFPCKAEHDLLVGMLMFRAQNVRSAMQEEQIAASRGVLAAPSQQEK